MLKDIVFEREYPSMFLANVGDRINLIFNNGDCISGKVTFPPRENMLRVQTVFGGDTWISLHSITEFEVLEERIPVAPFEPEENNEVLWGYFKDAEKGVQYPVQRTKQGIWRYGSRGYSSWEQLKDVISDSDPYVTLEFVELVERVSNEGT